MRRQWTLIGLAAATRFSSGMLMGTALAVYVESQGSPLFAGVLAAAYFAGLMVFSPVWGAIADVTGRRRAVMVATGLLSAVAVIPLLFVDGVWAAIGARALFSVFAAGYAPVVLAIVSHHGGASGRGRSVGIYNSARSGGSAAGNLGAGVLLGFVAPASPAVLFAVAGLSMVCVLAAAYIDDPTPTPPAASWQAVGAEVKRRLFPAPDDRGHLRTKGLRWLYVGLAARNLCVLGVMALMGPYLLLEVGVSGPVMGGLLAVNHGSQVAFMFLLGVVADRVGRKPLIALGMAGSGLFAVVAAAMTLPSPGIGRVLVAGTGFLLLGFVFSSMTTGAVAFIGDVAPPERESELMGLRGTAKGLGGVFGPPLVGLAATYYSYEAAFAAASTLAFAASVLVAWRLTESRPAATARGSPADD
ncbi:MFS transporter [Halorarius litoreus]|uniref:MFS transporter n=1 Tax=Halorarius litoreus TaxID=2962676 RepID=UPI0020CF992B|nr:MFS transporter [Halorarius litoreus]